MKKKSKKVVKKTCSVLLAVSMCGGLVPVQALAQNSENVILNQNVTVTGTEINTRPDMSLEKVNDGDKGTRVSTVGQSEEDIVFEFTLDGPKQIDRAEIFERCDRNYGDHPRIDEIKIQVQNGTEWQTVKNLKKVSKNEGNEMEHITVTFDPIVADGKVRVITTDKEKANPTIWEIEVYGTDKEAAPSYQVTYQLGNLTADGPEKVEIGKDLEVTLTADYGYELPDNIKVKIGNEELKGGYTYDKNTGKVTVTGADKDVTITAAGIEHEVSASGLVRLKKGSASQIDVSFQDSETPVTWTSSDESVAIVDENGNVKAVSEGTVVISAVSGDEVEYCTVVVDGYMRTWYDEPAKSWERDCLPIGNGNLGGMIYGNTEKERVQVNEITLWSKGDNYQGGNKEGAWKNLKPIQDEMFSRLDNDFSGINVNGILGNQNGCGAYQSLGDIYFDFEGAARTANPKNYVRELDLDDGFVRVSYENKGVQFTREYMASYPDNVMAFRLTSSKEDALSFKLDYDQGSGRTAIVDKAEENEILYQGKVTAGGMAFATEVKVVAPKADVTCNGDGTISVENGEDVLVLMSAGTNYDITESKNIKNISDFYTADGDYLDNDDPNGDVVASEVGQRLDTASEKGYAELVKTHMNDYQEIMERVSLDLGDEEKAAMPTDELLDAYKKERSNYAETLLFQFGRYLLLSSSRDSLPANLQGIWNASNSPGWNSDYHFNVNLQMNYWPAFVTDMSETAMPLVNYMDSLRDPGNVTAREHFGVQDGWVVNTEANPFGKTAPGDAFSWGFTPGSGAWTCQNLWDYYEFTKDPEVLEKIYPILKEGAEFWLGYMVEDPRTCVDGVEGTGELVTAPGGSSEHGPIGVGTTYDMSLAYMEMKNTAEAAKILGVDVDLQQEISEALPRMKPFWIGTDGQLKEWREETGYSSMPGTEKLHRHLSHLLALHPGNLITKEGGEFSEYYDAAVRALELRDDGSSAVGWSMAQKGNIFARVRDGEKALHHMNLLLTKGLGDNLLDVYVHPAWGDIFQVEANMGYTAGVAEMLLQSHQGAIEPLPALPQAWADGSYTGLVARGNYKTDAQWSDSHLDRFVIHAKEGGECVVKYPNISEAVLEGGTFTVVDKDTVKIDTVKGGEYVFTEIPTEAPVEGLKNVALDRPVTMTGADIYDRDDLKLTHINDGKLDTRMAIANSGQHTPEVQFDFALDGTQEIERVELYEYLDRAWGANGRIDKVEVQIPDGDGWKTIATKDTPDDGQGDGKRQLTVSFDPVVTEKVRVQVTDNEKKEPTIWEMEIYGRKAEMQTVDKSNLTSLIDYAKSQQEKEEYKYVVQIVKEKFEKALANAESINTKEAATQEEVDTVYEELLKMVQYLEFTGNSESLKVLVDAAKGLNEKLYTPESWNVLKDALAKAEEVLTDENALQEEIDAARDALQSAMDSLVKITVDKSKLQKLVNDSKKYEEKLDEYTKATAEIFTGALKNARDILAKEDATQEEVNAAYAALQNAIFGLRLIPNKDKLDELIKEAEKTDFAMYTAESGNAVKTALRQAKAVFADENATEKEVAKAEKDLKAAMDGLKVVSNDGNTAGTDNKGNGTSKDTDKKAAKTGDTANVMWLFAMVAAAGAVLVRRKK